MEAPTTTYTYTVGVPSFALAERRVVPGGDETISTVDASGGQPGGYPSIAIGADGIVVACAGGMERASSTTLDAATIVANGPVAASLEACRRLASESPRNIDRIP